MWSAPVPGVVARITRANIAERFLPAKQPVKRVVGTLSFHTSPEVKSWCFPHSIGRFCDLRKVGESVM